MTDTLERREAMLEARNKWLVDALHYAIQFYVYAEASRDDVAKVVDSLSDSDEYDDNVAALVQMPKWCSPSEAQDAVDLALSLPAREVSGERDDAFEESVVSLHRYDTSKDRERAKEAVGIARLRTLATTPDPREKLEADLALLNEAFDMLGGCDDASDLRQRILNRLSGEG